MSDTDRGYQFDFAGGEVAQRMMYDQTGREQKAATMVAVLADYFDQPLAELDLLTIGASTGIIDNYLSQHLGKVHGVDIDERAIEHARSNFQRDNLSYAVGDAMALDAADASVDIIICSQVYEHVPDQEQLMNEIERVLEPGGVCYFAANNRLMLIEPHYRIPLLSVMPKALADRMMRWTGKGEEYYEKHRSLAGLRDLTDRFEVIDYTVATVTEPERFGTEYLVPPGSWKARIGGLIVRKAYWASPGYIWLLRKSSAGI